MIASLLLHPSMAVLDKVTAPRLSILIFHRVQPQRDPLFPHEMHARRFDALLTQLAASFNVLTLGDAHARWRAGRLPARALVITFDDGYADNAEIAMPILQRHHLRATFFVSTGYLDGGRMFNDTVIEALRRCEAASVDLSALGLGSWPVATLPQRRAVIDAVLPIIKYRPLGERQGALELLLRACGPVALPDDLMMQSEQVRELHVAGMEIGGHTVRHPILTELDDQEAESEIVQGRNSLQGIIGAPVDVFAYPNGRPGRDYDGRHVAMVRRLGFRCAVSTAPGVVRSDDDEFQWPRFTPWDESDPRWLVRLAVTRYRRGQAASAESVAVGRSPNA